MSAENISVGDPALDNKIAEWLKYDKNEVTISQIKKIVANDDVEQLRKIMMTRLQFGTAGLRGVMGAGYSRLNDLVIIQTSQGLAKYILSVNPENAKKGVVIGFDNRHNSANFANLTCAVFLHHGFNVYFLEKLCPTPFVPFSILKKKASAGIMITASHNPKEDNGYKVYWDNGAQIIPPHDVHIQSSIEENLCPMHGIWQYAHEVNENGHDNLCTILSETIDAYSTCLSDTMFDKEMNGKSPLRFVATAMHGVAHEYLDAAFSTCNFQPYIPVKEQMVPDPEFPTVKFPNPEEGKSALDLSIKTAENEGISIILANDPDADRLAVAEKLPTGTWKVFTGNEEGTLLGWWSWYRHLKINPDEKNEDLYILASNVSSKMLQAIALKEGFNFVETLTGFKWMGNKSHELIENGKTVLFAFEEAIGYMNGTMVLDKDGISAAVRIAELATYLALENKTLNQKLMELYKDYGYHLNQNSYYICHDSETIANLFNRIRNYNGDGTYPEELCNGKLKIQSVKDLTTGYDSTTVDKKTVLPASASNQSITFIFTNGCIVTLRTSGTEPKIKYYSEICSSLSSSSFIELHTELEFVIANVIEELLQPIRNNLIPKTD